MQPTSGGRDEFLPPLWLLLWRAQGFDCNRGSASQSARYGEDEAAVGTPEGHPARHEDGLLRRRAAADLHWAEHCGRWTRASACTVHPLFDRRDLDAFREDVSRGRAGGVGGGRSSSGNGAKARVAAPSPRDAQNRLPACEYG